MHAFFIIAVRKIFSRLFYVCMAALSIIAAAISTAWGLEVFDHTAYRFVLVFIMIILLSNVLAKITTAFIEA